MPRFIKSFGSIVLAVLIGLLIAEGATRIIFRGYTPVLRLYQRVESERGKFARYDPLLGWVGKKDVEDDFEWVDTRHHVKQNRYGFRGPAYDFTKDKAKRIAVLGDSFVWGFGVENEDIFTSLLDKRGGESLEVVNLGVSGYSTDQEYLLWRELGHKWKADQVLLFITPITDLGEILSPKAHNISKPSFKIDTSGKLIQKSVPIPSEKKWGTKAKPIKLKKGSTTQRILAHSTIANLVVGATLRNSTIRKWFASLGIIPQRTLGNKWDYLVYMNDPTKEDQMGWQIIFSLVEKINDSVTKSGGELTVVIIPSMLQVYPELWERYTTQEYIPKNIELDPKAPIRRIKKACERMDIEVINLLTDFKEASKNNPYLYYPFNRHWTKEGNRLVADVLWRELKK